MLLSMKNEGAIFSSFIHCDQFKNLAPHFFPVLDDQTFVNYVCDWGLHGCVIKSSNKSLSERREIFVPLH